MALDVNDRAAVAVARNQSEGMVTIWDLEQHIELWRIARADLVPSDAALSPAGDLVSVGFSDGTVRVFRMRERGAYPGAFYDRPWRQAQLRFGLAIDVHTFVGPSLGTLRVDRDYEQGLGDAVDCVGAPLTQGGAVLKVLQCQLVRSGLFHLVLSPDYDDAHHDHFHLEVKPWADRPALRADAQAIH